MIERMMAKLPDDRFATAAEVAAAMAPFAAGGDLARVSAEAAATAGGTVVSNKSLIAAEPFASCGVVGADAGGSVKSFEPHVARCFGKPRRLWFAVGGASLFAIVLLGVLISLRTRNGTLVIESNDPNVQVAVKQGGELVEVVDAQSGWKLSLEPGQYELVPQGSTDRFQLDQHSVTVRRGEVITAKVTLKLARPIPRPAVAPFDAKKGKEHQQAWVDSAHASQREMKVIKPWFPGAEPGDTPPEPPPGPPLVFAHEDLHQFLTKTFKPMRTPQLCRMLYTEIATTIDQGQPGRPVTWVIGSALTNDGKGYEIAVRAGGWFPRVVRQSEAAEKGLEPTEISRSVVTPWRLPVKELVSLGTPELHVVHAPVVAGRWQAELLRRQHRAAHRAPGLGDRVSFGQRRLDQ